MKSTTLFTFAAAVCLASHSGWTQEPDAPPLSLYRNVPEEPLFVSAVAVDAPGQALDELLRWIGRFSDSGHKTVAPRLTELNQTLGFSVQDDLLQQIGPEIVLAIDFPPIDEVIGALNHAGPGMSGSVLGGVGIVAAVRDAERLTPMVQRVFHELGARFSEVGELHRVDVPLSRPQTPGDDVAGVSVYYGIERNIFALGFAAEWVSDALHRDAAGDLGSGQDFRRVFSSLDPRPTGLTYVNLPKLGRWVGDSQVAQAVLGADPQSATLISALLGSELTEVGMGSTSTAVDGGTRTTHFGPRFISGATLSAGLLAALFMPDVVDRVDRGEIQETLESIRTIATACEGFSTDLQGYPGPTEGWVPVERIAMFLEPVYVGRLPVHDAWKNPILYWSDGQSYRIISLGRDGQMDRDWTKQTDPRPGDDSNSDILFANGQFLVLPPQIVNE